jgi:hypothetical protein
MHDELIGIVTPRSPPNGAVAVSDACMHMAAWVAITAAAAAAAAAALITVMHRGGGGGAQRGGVVDQRDELPRARHLHLRHRCGVDLAVGAGHERGCARISARIPHLLDRPQSGDRQAAACTQLNESWAG